jgi:hypothetical protein
MGGKTMPAARLKIHDMHLGRTSPLPPHFGSIDPQSAFDPKRFFTAKRCIGFEPQVGYLIDEGEVQLVMKLPPQKTLLQRRRLKALNDWEAMQDPTREKQFKYLSEILKRIPFASRTESDGPIRYFQCHI